MTALHDSAPAKINLCLYVGPTRDGRPPRARERLPADRARRRGRARARRPGLGDGSRDLPGVEGENLAAAGPAALSRAHRLERRPGAPPDREADPGRGRDGRRQRRRRRRPAARGRARPGSTTTRSCARSAPGSAPTSPLRSRPRRYLATGAGERLTPLPPPAPYGVLVIPSRARALDRRRLPRGRSPGAAARRGRARRSAARGLATAAADLPDELIVNDLEPAARALCPEIDDALATARERRRPPRARVRIGADRRRPVRRPARRARRRGAPVRRASRARSPSRRGGRRVKPVWLVFAAALAAFLVWRRRRLEPTLLAGGALVAVGRARLRPRRSCTCPNLEQAADRRRRAARASGPTCSSARWPSCETGAFIGLIAPGETAMLLGGLVAGQGQIDVLTMIAVVWACAVAGDLTSFYPRPPPRPRLHGQARPEGADHRGAPAAGRGLLRPPRRQGDPHRALRRPRARRGAVPGRLVRHAAAALHALRRHRRRAVGLDLRRARLRLLAELQPARRLREEGRAGAGPRSSCSSVAIVWLVRWLRDPENRARMREWMERQAQRPALRPLVAVLRAGPAHEPAAGPLRLGPRDARATSGSSSTTLFAVAGVGGLRLRVGLVRIEQDNGLLAGDAAVAAAGRSPRTWTRWSAWRRS